MPKPNLQRFVTYFRDNTWPNRWAWLGFIITVIGAVIFYWDTVYDAAYRAALGTSTDDLLLATAASATLALALTLAPAGYALVPAPDNPFVFGVVLALICPGAAVLLVWLSADRQLNLTLFALLGAVLILIGMLVPIAATRKGQEVVQDGEPSGDGGTDDSSEPEGPSAADVAPTDLRGAERAPQPAATERPAEQEHEQATIFDAAPTDHDQAAPAPQPSATTNLAVQQRDNRAQPATWFLAGAATVIGLGWLTSFIDRKVGQ